MTDSLARYRSDLQEMRQLRDGDALAQAARSVLAQLGDGQILLLAESVEGLALAATVAALREASTTWRPLELARPRSVPSGTQAVVVEAIEPAEGLRKAITAAYPGVRILAPRVKLASVAV